jgi:hypothetical protein
MGCDLFSDLCGGSLFYVTLRNVEGWQRLRKALLLGSHHRSLRGLAAGEPHAMQPVFG